MIIVILFLRTPEHVPLDSFLTDKVQWQLSLLQLKRSRFMVLGLAVGIVHVELFMGQVFSFLTYDWIFFCFFLFHMSFSFPAHLIVFS